MSSPKNGEKGPLSQDTNDYDTDPASNGYKPAKEMSTRDLAQSMNEHERIKPKEIVGITLKVIDQEFRAFGVRSEAAQNADDLQAQIEGLSSKLKAPTHSDDLQGIIGQGEGVVKDTLFDIWIYVPTLILVTTAFKNLTFNDTPITPKDRKDKHCKTRPCLIHNRTTLAWFSEFNGGKGPNKDTPRHNFVLEFFQKHEGQSNLLPLPIIIDPGNQNGGTAGWPT